MEPNDPFAINGDFYKFLSNNVDSNSASYSTFCSMVKRYFQNDKISIDHFRFYEKFLKSKSFHHRLIEFYSLVGDLEKARDLAKQLGIERKVSSISVHIGDLPKVEAYEALPEPNCNIALLSTWLFYHQQNRTLVSRLNGYTHETLDGNALIQLFLGNVEKANRLFVGDALEAGEELYFKFICASILNNNKEASEIYNQIIFKEVSYYALYSIFFICQFIQISHTKAICDHFFNNLPPNNLNRVLREDEQSGGQFLYQIAKEYPNPITKFYTALRSKCAESVALRTLGVVQQGKRINSVDHMVFDHYNLKGNGAFLIQYGEMRYKECPRPFFAEMVLRGRYLDTSIPHDSNEWLSKTDEWIEEYKKTGGDLPFISDIIGYTEIFKGNFEKALYFFNVHYVNCGFNPISIVGFTTVHIKKGETEEAKKFIIERSKTFKNPSVLDMAELILQNDPKSLAIFYEENIPYAPEYKTKLAAMEDKIAGPLNAAYENKDLLEVDSETALRILSYRIRHKINCPKSYSMRAFHFHKLGMIEEANKDLVSRFASLISPHSQAEFDTYCAKYPEFMRLVLNHFPKIHPWYLPYAAHIHFHFGEWQKALDCYKIILKTSNHIRYQLNYILCFYSLGNFMSARFFLGELERTEGLDAAISADLKQLRLEIDENERNSKEKKEGVKPTIRKETNRSLKGGYSDPFKLETPFVSEAKQAHIDRQKREAAKAAPVLQHTGSKSMKNAVDPIIKITRSHFDPAAFKPKEEEIEPVLAPAMIAKPKEEVKPLFKVSLTSHEKSRVEYVVERLKNLIHLEELVKKGEIEEKVREPLLHRNYLYNYLRSFGILKDLANAPLKDHLENIRNQARHHFNVSSSASCLALLNYLKEVKLINQLEDWLAGGLVTKLAVSPYSLLDKEKNREFESLPQLEKDKRRLEFMKEELEILKTLMEPIKTFELFQREDFYQNAIKMSLMMIAKSWTKLNPDLKKKLAPYFRDLNLEGNKSAHVFKDTSQHDKIIFKIGFEDIPIDRLWNFAAQTQNLKVALENHGTLKISA